MSAGHSDGPPTLECPVCAPFVLAAEPRGRLVGDTEAEQDADRDARRAAWHAMLAIKLEHHRP